MADYRTRTRDRAFRIVGLRAFRWVVFSQEKDRQESYCLKHRVDGHWEDRSRGRFQGRKFYLIDNLLGWTASGEL